MSSTDDTFYVCDFSFGHGIVCPSFFDSLNRGRRGRDDMVVVLTTTVGLTTTYVISRGGSSGGRAPPKIGKNMIFWRKIVIFHTKYPNNFRASLRNWKKYDFLV